MEYGVKTGQPGKQRTACAIVGLYEDAGTSSTVKQIDSSTGRSISSAIRRGDASGKRGSLRLLNNSSKGGPSRVLTVGCGKKADLNAKTLRKLVQNAVTALKGTNCKDAICYLGDDVLDSYTRGRSSVEGAAFSLYRFNDMKSGTPDVPTLQNFYVSGEKDAAEDLELGIQHASAIARGVASARRLGDLPANVCNPSFLADHAKSLAQGNKKLTAKILDRAEAKKLKMNTFLSVSAGAHEPPKFIILKYTGTKKTENPYVLVGKGITFDTGGISMKPAYGMDEMKFDMCGAGGVLGTMEAVAHLDLPINVIALIPTCSNMPGGNATKPGDIIKSMSGQTVEILNTDAEGRLILCDALTYAQQFKPKSIIDVATLTGACVIALGHVYTGLMSPSNGLAQELLDAGEQAVDPAWRLPMADEYGQKLKSNFADFANVAGREGGAITAACFLSKFTQGETWAHLDVAGTAWQSGSAKGATGRPVPLLTQYFLNQLNQES